MPRLMLTGTAESLGQTEKRRGHPLAGRSPSPWEFDCGQLLTAAAGEGLTDLDHGISETVKEVFPYEE